jgi:hypothetical protein
MPKESGGAMPANTREGFRSETLARFALSAFGPVSAVEVPDDHGIDLVCATSRRNGQRLHVGGGYLVQVKSNDAKEVTYSGPHVREWLENLGSPLFVCCVDKASTEIRLYSTWSISRVLLNVAAYDKASPETFRLVMDQDVTGKEPEPDAIPLGKPVVKFAVTQLHDSKLVDNFRLCIEEWVRMDSENLLNRRSKLAIAHGFTEWETNKPPSVFNRWYRPYFYSAKTAVDARRIISECAVLIALMGESEEKGVLASYVNKFCDLKGECAEWTRGRLGI